MQRYNAVFIAAVRTNYLAAARRGVTVASSHYPRLRLLGLYTEQVCQKKISYQPSNYIKRSEGRGADETVECYGPL